MVWEQLQGLKRNSLKGFLALPEVGGDVPIIDAQTGKKQLTIVDLLDPAILPAGFSLTNHYPINHLTGCTMSNGADATNDIDIGIGSARDVSDSYNINLASPISGLQLDELFGAGVNGGRDGGPIANGTWHVFLIRNSATPAVVKGLFSLDPESPTMPAGYDVKQRIGSVLREGGAIVPFNQKGRKFMRKTPVRDYNVANPGTAAVLRTLSVPTGVKVEAIHTVGLYDASTSNVTYLAVTDPDLTDYAPSATQFTFLSEDGGATRESMLLDCYVNTLAQIRTRLSFSDGDVVLSGITQGWYDIPGVN